ncbi:peroxidase 57-like [Benincasa hispida]|uniref:peroxidase 57-like n=1 Tax=Benincasa hispida TaxID=102211 RepID=UPI0019028C52|nr:peroxidase 57-like [Benincasa hispida]
MKSKCKMQSDLCGEAKLMALLMVGIVMISKVYSQELRVGFYSETCPLAENIVRTTVAKAVAQNPGMGAGLIRMHFHDCIVLGCDASILLDKTPQNPDSEKDSIGNPLLRGFEIIDDAKFEIESRCPETVSCADILAFAARDSVATLGQFTYAVPGGRRDSLVSHGINVSDNVPFPSTNIAFLVQHFEERGLSLRDMVALSGAHSIGRTGCPEFSERLFSSNGTEITDPSLDPIFATTLREKCPFGSGFDKTADLDNVTPNHLDVQFFENLKNKMGVLSSDQAIATDPLTAAIVSTYQGNRAIWMRDFSAAMVKMGKLQVLTGTQGEIRKDCHFRN